MEKQPPESGQSRDSALQAQAEALRVLGDSLCCPRQGVEAQYEKQGQSEVRSIGKVVALHATRPWAWSPASVNQVW